ncbi:hypothetical protein EVAR_37303_1 [Eumeta japonica]|uniref:Uncharacterized protein n=1 Tax=Eumeta variegata TaxID=151549 RepID=A0A4C1X1I8_EUMVA|nr:hypothetical protein EVAR_37303_1 [Eumeta japonica]
MKRLERDPVYGQLASSRVIALVSRGRVVARRRRRLCEVDDSPNTPAALSCRRGGDMMNVLNCTLIVAVCSEQLSRQVCPRFAENPLEILGPTAAPQVGRVEREMVMGDSRPRDRARPAAGRDPALAPLVAMRARDNDQTYADEYVRPPAPRIRICVEGAVNILKSTYVCNRVSAVGPRRRRGRLRSPPAAAGCLSPSAVSMSLSGYLLKFNLSVDKRARGFIEFLGVVGVAFNHFRPSLDRYSDSHCTIETYNVMLSRKRLSMSIRSEVLLTEYWTLRMHEEYVSDRFPRSGPRSGLSLISA